MQNKIIETPGAKIREKFGKSKRLTQPCLSAGIASKEVTAAGTELNKARTANRIQLELGRSFLDGIGDLGWVFKDQPTFPD